MVKQDETSTYVTDLGDIRIRYTAKKETNKSVQHVSVHITRSNEYIGSANIDANGSSGITLKEGVSFEEMKEICTNLFENSKEIFETLNTVE